MADTVSDPAPDPVPDPAAVPDPVPAPEAAAETETEYGTYEEFGVEFFRTAVSEERILGAISGVAGDTFNFGPLAVGPGKIAKVNAVGHLGTPWIARIDGPEVRFRLSIPVEVKLVVHVPLDDHKFRADLVVHLKLTARAAKPLRVVIDIDTPTKEDVDCVLEAESMRASLLNTIAGVESELKRFVAKYVAREVQKPHIMKAKDIDVAARISGAWERTGGTSGVPGA